MGYEVIRWLQALMPGLTWETFWAMVSEIYSEDIYLGLLPMVYWLAPRSFARLFGSLFLINGWFNVGLKGLFGQPRPDPAMVRVTPVGLDSSGAGYGIPSGHAQGASVTWLTLARQVRRRWFTALAVAIVVLVGIARVHLGVHFPLDVLAGWAFGLLVIWVGPAVYRRVAEALAAAGLPLQLALGLAVPALMMWAWAAIPFTAGVGVYELNPWLGALSALWVGSALEERYVGFHHNGTVGHLLLKVLIGVPAVFAVRYGLKAVFPPDSGLFYYLRYFCIGMTAMLLLPWLFTRLPGYRRA